jgi:hypothetical protein
MHRVDTAGIRTHLAGEVGPPTAHWSCKGYWVSSGQVAYAGGVNSRCHEQQGYKGSTVHVQHTCTLTDGPANQPGGRQLNLLCTGS